MNLLPVSARVLDRLLDRVWHLTLPFSGRCPVCAFWRGVLLGVVASAGLAWLT